MDALVLAGGRSSRLGGTAKALLTVKGRSLVQLAVDTAGAAGARQVAVVGPAELAEHVTAPAAVRVVFAREHPPFGGPAAGVAAGLSALAAACDRSRQPAADTTALLACDQPAALSALRALQEAARNTAADVPPAEALDARGADGWVAVDPAGRVQHLCALHRTGSLVRRVSGCARETASGDLDGVSMRRLVEGLTLREVPVPAASVADVDTWADAAERGVDAPPPSLPEPSASRALAGAAATSGRGA